MTTTQSAELIIKLHDLRCDELAAAAPNSTHRLELGKASFKSMAEQRTKK